MGSTAAALASERQQLDPVGAEEALVAAKRELGDL